MPILSRYTRFSLILKFSAHIFDLAVNISIKNGFENSDDKSVA